MIIFIILKFSIALVFNFVQLYCYVQPKSTLYFGLHVALFIWNTVTRTSSCQYHIINHLGRRSSNYWFWYRTFVSKPVFTSIHPLEVRNDCDKWNRIWTLKMVPIIEDFVPVKKARMETRVSKKTWGSNLQSLISRWKMFSYCSAQKNIQTHITSVKSCFPVLRRNEENWLFELELQQRWAGKENQFEWFWSYHLSK